ncbi:MAG: endonuclease III [Acidimicrobiia bacterium]
MSVRPPKKAGPRSLRARAKEIGRRLADRYPAHCALTHGSPYELLVATVLSAQCTDARVNQVTPALFQRYPFSEALARADPAELEELIRPTGFFRSKARNLIGLAMALEDRFGGEVPTALDDLVTLPGVGRKTGNVVRSVAFGLPGLPVDTHVGRLSRRLGLSVSEDPVQVESDLMALLPPQDWGDLSLRLILHGRAVCVARRPRCGDCLLIDLCPSRLMSPPSPSGSS